MAGTMKKKNMAKMPNSIQLSRCAILERLLDPNGLPVNEDQDDRPS